jgi:hypothetical protein
MCNICVNNDPKKDISFKCSHEMCGKCFTKWVIVSNNEDPKKNITCPYCRTDLILSQHVNHERAFLREMIMDGMEEYETPTCSQEQEYLENSLEEYIEC